MQFMITVWKINSLQAFDVWSILHDGLKFQEKSKKATKGVFGKECIYFYLRKTRAKAVFTFFVCLLLRV